MPDPAIELECFVVAYCLPEYTQRAIDAFRRTGGTSKLTVLDNSPELSTFQNIDRYYHFPWNPSLSRVWNWALAMAKTPWAMILNTDAVCYEGWADVFRNAEHMNPCLIHSRFSHFVINRKALRKVGWFDERLTTIYWEDTDYVRRLAIAGEPWCKDCPLNQFLHNEYPEPRPHPIFKKYANERAEALKSPNFKNNEIRFHDKWGDNEHNDLAGGTPTWEDINWYPCVELPNA